VVEKQAEERQMVDNEGFEEVLSRRPRKLKRQEQRIKQNIREDPKETLSSQKVSKNVTPSEPCHYSLHNKSERRTEERQGEERQMMDNDMFYQGELVN